MCFLCTQANASIAIKVIPYKSHGELFYKTCGVAHVVQVVLFMIQHCTEAALFHNLSSFNSEQNPNMNIVGCSNRDRSLHDLLIMSLIAMVHFSITCQTNIFLSFSPFFQIFRNAQ